MMSEPTVLAEIRRALGRSESTAPPPLSPAVPPADDESSEQVLARFIEEVTAVRGQIHTVRSSEEVIARIAEICIACGAGDVALSGAALLSEMNLVARLAEHNVATFETAGFARDERDDLIARLAGCGAGVTAIDYAIAETGTIVLSSDEEHALLVSLLPPVHIAVVLPQQIKGTLVSAVSWLNDERMGRGRPCSANFITGPSRTGDVELILSIGVHGPKELHLIILAE